MPCTTGDAVVGLSIGFIDGWLVGLKDGAVMILRLHYKIDI